MNYNRIGGDIDETRAYKHILSIGYEIETGQLVKLTELNINYKTGNDEKILLNTDTTPANMSRLTPDDGEEISNYDFLERQEEKLSLDIGKNATFYITNDMAETTLVKRLRKICKNEIIDTEPIDTEPIDSNENTDSENTDNNSNSNHKSGSTFKSTTHTKSRSNKTSSKSHSIKSISSHVSKPLRNSIKLRSSAISPRYSNPQIDPSINMHGNQNSTHSNNGSMLKYIMGKGTNSSDNDTILDYTNSKNKKYKYRKTTGEEYSIHFAYWDKINSVCEAFSDVEWVVTYYKPKLHSNIILDTFAATIRKLLHHLNELKRYEGELIMKDPTSDKPDVVISDMDSNSLYHLPKTNLHYLKINNGGLDNVLTTIQMTFSAHIEDVFFIMKELLEDKLCSYSRVTDQCELKLNYLNKIEYCAKMLIKTFNRQEPVFKIQSSTHKLVLRQIKNYIVLILYKLYIYYNDYKPRGDRSVLFKAMLALNVRHSNYALYVELKKCLTLLFEDIREDSVNIEDIIKRIFIQPAILYEYLLTNKSHVRKGAFNINNHLDKQNKHYGNPWYSLVSYFDFFEDPTDDDSNRFADDTLITHDWLEYDGVDASSTKMDINNNVVLVEFRTFPYLLKSYIFSILDPNEREEMNTYTRDILGLLSVKTLHRFIERYDKKHQNPNYLNSTIVSEPKSEKYKNSNAAAGIKTRKRKMKSVKKKNTKRMHFYAN
jgi:hypothetical protein